MNRFAFLVFTSVSAFGQQPEIRNPYTTPADVNAGAKIFRSHCAQCHGAKGAGGLGPNLTSGVFHHGSTDADLYRNITDGIPGTAMPGVFFDGTQAWQIVAFVRSLAESAGTTPVGNAKRGEALFHEKGCAGCHAVGGEGGYKGPDLSFIGSQRSAEHIRQAIVDPNSRVLRDYRIAQITMRGGGSYSGLIMNEDTHTVQVLDFSQGLRSLPRDDIATFELNSNSAMPTYKDQLKNEDLDDLVTYLYSLKRPRRIQ